MTAETKGVLQHQPFGARTSQRHGASAGHGKLNLRVDGVGIDVAGQRSFTQRLQAKNRLNGSCGSQQMPELALWGEDGNVIGGCSKAAAQRSSFGKVTQAGAGGMGLHSTEIAWLHPRPAQGILDRQAGLGALGLWSNDVMAVAAAAAGQLPTQGRATGSVFFPHHGQHPSPLGEHESVTILAVRPGGLFRGIVAG